MPLTETTTEEEPTLAEYWADYIGSVSSSEVIPGGANLSENTGRKFAELMMEKRRQNRKRSFDEIVAPLREDFRASAMTEEELDSLIEEAREEVWQNKQKAAGFSLPPHVYPVSP